MIDFILSLLHRPAADPKPTDLQSVTLFFPYAGVRLSAKTYTDETGETYVWEVEYQGAWWEFPDFMDVAEDHLGRDYLIEE